MTTYTILCSAHADIEHQVTMEPDYEPEVIDTYATKEHADRLCETFNDEDGHTWCYWVHEGQLPVTVWA